MLAIPPGKPDGDALVRPNATSAEARRLGSVARRTAYRHALEWGASTHATQQEPTPAHVAPPHEGGREIQTITKDPHERRYVLVRGDAAEEHRASIEPQCTIESSGVAHERLAETRIVVINRNSPHGLEVGCANQELGGDEPSARRDDQGTRPAGWRRPESLGIQELAAEVETAHEREDFPERSPAISEPPCQGDGPPIEQHLGTFARAARR